MWIAWIYRTQIFMAWSDLLIAAMGAGPVEGRPPVHVLHVHLALVTRSGFRKQGDRLVDFAFFNNSILFKYDFHGLKIRAIRAFQRTGDKLIET
jgi:hypothetical protein